MLYKGQLKIDLKTESPNRKYLELKVGEVQRLLWKLFGASATLSVSLEEKEELFEWDAESETFKPGTNLKGLR